MSSSEQAQFVVVDGIHDARNLIFATWLRCLEANSPAAKNIPRDVFFAEHHKVLERILARDPIVKLAVLPDDPSVVLGWSVSEPWQRVDVVDREAGILKVDQHTVLHFVYVKPSFRKYGLGSALVSHIQQPFTYTHWTYVLRDLHPKIKDNTFNPYKV